jgi:hypothetical protein
MMYDFEYRCERCGCEEEPFWTYLFFNDDGVLLCNDCLFYDQCDLMMR